MDHASEEDEIVLDAMSYQDEVDIDVFMEEQHTMSNSGKNKHTHVNAKAETEDEIRVLLPESPRLDTLESQATDITRLRSTIKNLESTIDAMEGEMQSLRASLSTSNQQPAIPTNDTTNTLNKLLPQDTFSFLLVSKATSVTFWVSLFVYGFQMAIFTLVMVDGIRAGAGAGNNPFAIPGDVSAQVRMSQFMAILVAVFTQGDLMTGFGSLRDGYNPLQMQSLFVDSSQWKYILSLVARLSEGALGLMVSFLLIVSAEEVKELLLNFTAIEFVSKLDEVMFFLSRQGFLGRSCKAQATSVAEIPFQREGDKKHGRIVKMVLLMGILTSMMIGWAIVIHFQLSGKYLCKTVQVQFADDFIPELGPFAGLYDLRTPNYNPFSQERASYVERRALEVGFPPAKFAYCDELKAWTFHWPAYTPKINITGPPNTDPCVEWVARSAETDTFELSETGTLDWVVRNENGREVGLTPFHLQCFECQDELEDCGGHGVCIQDDNSFANNLCRCDPGSGFYGLRCEFTQPCTKLAVDSPSGDGFVSTRSWADDYEQFFWNGEPVEAYNRPIYIHAYGDENKNSYDLILFLGRRWGITSSRSLLRIGKSERVTEQALAGFFQNKFYAHAINANSSFAFLSEPADAGTPKDDSSPMHLHWFRTQTNRNELEADIPSQPVDPTLICKVCDDRSNPCSYDGQCINSTCHCSPGSSGALCQVPPVGNGYCNSWFNTPEYAYDKGDCCESVCHSTEEYQCGYDEFGWAFKGYPACLLPRDEWQAHGETIVGDPFALSGSLVALARQGGSLAIAEPGSNQLRLFDKDGSEWYERLIHPSNSIMSGIDLQSLAMSSGPEGGQLNAPGIFLAPLLVAISGRGKDRGNATAFVFYCDIEKCETVETIQSASRLAISEDGSVLATTQNSYVGQPNPRALHFWEWQGPGSNLTLRETVELKTLREIHSFRSIGRRERLSFKGIQLSRNGDVVAVEVQTTLAGDPHEIVQTVLTMTWNGSSYLRGVSLVDDRYFQLDEGANIERETLIRSSFAMSPDGTLVVMTDTKCAHQAYERKFGSWIKLGSAFSSQRTQRRCEEPSDDFYGDEYDGDSIAILPNRAVVIGRDSTDVATFEWDGSAWTQMNQQSLESDKRVTLASSGETLAVGLPASQRNNAGGTYLYSRVPSPPEDSDFVRVSITPHTLATTWTLESNASGALLAQGGGGWGLASSTRQVAVETSDCAIFSVYPYELSCAPISQGKCKPPATLPKPRYHLLRGRQAGKEWMDEPSSHLGECDQSSFAPKRTAIGDACIACSRNTQSIEIMVSACSPTTWDLKARDGSILMEERSNCQEESNIFESDKSPCLNWYRECIDVNGCYTFSISVEEIASKQPPNIAALVQQGDTKSIPVDYYVYVDGSMVVSGIESNEVQIGKCKKQL